MVLLAFLLCAVLLGLATGGRLDRLAGTQMRGEVPILLVYLLQAVTRRYVPSLGFIRAEYIVWAWSILAMILILLTLRNYRIVGMPIVTVGLILNLVVVVANAGMPVGEWGSLPSERSEGVANLKNAGAFYRRSDAQTRLPFLGDVVPLRGRAGSGIVLSVGDLLMFLGVGVVVLAGMHGRSRPHDSSVADTGNSD